MHNRFWWIELVRGVLTLAFGIVALSVHTVLYLLITLLGIYLLADSCLDLFHIIRSKQTARRYLSIYLGAAVSGSLGLLSLIDAHLILFLIGGVFVLRMVIRGIQVFGEARRWQGRFAGLHWLYGIVLVLLGLICLLPAVFVFVSTFVLLFLGLYALGDGLYLLGRALHLGIVALHSTVDVLPQQVVTNLLDIPTHLPLSTRRVLIFLRRSGASGLGHIGWAFEWLNGWFNVGSVENYGNRAFASAGQADFWTAHTTSPVATMLKWGNAYDEYKVFFVTESHAKEAWNVVVWAGRQPYRLVHRNCVDTTYDILRTYGLTTLPDPVTEYAPNDWYASLTGRSYAVEAYPTLPLHLHRFSEHPLATREIALVVPKTFQGTLPRWRTSGSGLRGLIEIALIWQKMLSDVTTVVLLSGQGSAKCRQKAVQKAKKGMVSWWVRSQKTHAGK